MTTEFPIFTDLSALADTLATRGKAQLRAMMTQASRAQSCLADLRQACDCAAVLKGMINRPKDQDTSDLIATERALMTTVIMLYARATSTNGDKGERGSIQLSQKKLTSEEWIDHCAILDVRNQAMAHVYPSRKLGDHDWHRAIFFAVEAGNGQWSPASATNQTGFHAVTLARLDRALPIAVREVKAKFHERMAAVTKFINANVPAASLKQYLFDPVSVFGNADAVRLVLSGAGKGELSFWVNEGDRRADDV